jgi:hypothetical protein
MTYGRFAPLRPAGKYWKVCISGTVEVQRFLSDCTPGGVLNLPGLRCS